MSTSSSSERIGTPVNLPDVDEHVSAAADVAVHDVHPRAVVEPRILQPLGRIELAMRAGRVVEEPGERAHHVLVVVEDLVVEAARPVVALDEDRVRRVDLDLPDVVVAEQRCRAARSQLRLRSARSTTLSGSATSTERSPRWKSRFHRSTSSSTIDAELVVRDVFVHAEPLGSLLHPPLDLDERRVTRSSLEKRRHTASASVSDQRPRLPGVIAHRLLDGRRRSARDPSISRGERRAGDGDRRSPTGSATPPRTASSTALRAATNTGLASLAPLAATSVGNR